MDKITEIVVQYIENLERIERQMAEDMDDLSVMCRNLDLDNRLLITALERIADRGGPEAEIAGEALGAMTCKGER